MNTVQQSIISGLEYDAYTDQSQDYIYNRLPFLGQKVTYRDGREFVFASTLVDVPAGTLMGSPIALAEIDGGFTAAGIGATELTITHASILDNVTLDSLAGGTIIITETAGVKTSYQIVSNTAMASDIVVLQLAHPLVGAIAAADACVIVPSKFANVILNQSDATIPLGVAVVSSTVATTTTTTTGYQWFQTKGLGGVKVVTEAGCVAGTMATVSTTDGSADLKATASILPTIGTFVALAAVADGDLCPINLCIG